MVEPVNCVIGGSPCQNLSTAGNRKGLEGNESCLFLDQMRVIREMREASYGEKPRYMVWENVTNALSNRKGKDFQRVLYECVCVAVTTQKECLNGKTDEAAENSKQTKIPDVPVPKEGKWPNAGVLYDDLGGWSVAWRVHNAQHWGVAQRRRRVALVVDFGGLTAPQVLFERTNVSGGFDTCNTQGGGVTEALTGCVKEPDRQCGILDARRDGDGPLVSTIIGDHPITIDYAAMHQGPNSLFAPHIKEEETMPTLVAAGPGAVAAPPTYKARRLTPLECTRLQGFPDHWVDIGDWVDSKGKRHKEADTPKYKALGNSIALPFWKWLCRNIVAELRKNGTACPTMASLFDGIGGFPLCWSEATGTKESVLWISEIEEFPLAVTKFHFGHSTEVDNGLENRE